jgi:hypothetical protein
LDDRAEPLRAFGTADAVQKGLPGAPHVDVPTAGSQSLLQVLRVPEDFDDLELPAVCQCSAGCRNVAYRMNIVISGSSIIFIDERNAAIRREARPDKSEELVERRRRHMREPESEKHTVIRTIGRPRKYVSVHVRNPGVCDAPLIDGEHSSGGVDCRDGSRVTGELGGEDTSAARELENVAG